MNHVVYEAVTLEGTVLYVGTTSNIHHRLQNHHAREVWWVEVDHWRLTPFRNRVAALNAERELISRHRPPHNTYGNPENERAEPGARIDAIVRALTGGPMTTSELKASTGYRSVSTIVVNLEARGLVKAIGWQRGSGHSGYRGVWALMDFPSRAVPHPTRDRGVEVPAA